MKRIEGMKQMGIFRSSEYIYILPAYEKYICIFSATESEF